MNEDTLAAFMTEFPLSSPPIIQTLLIAIPPITPEPEFSTEIETGQGGTEADSTCGLVAVNA